MCFLTAIQLYQCFWETYRLHLQPWTMFLRNVGIYLRVHTVSQFRTTTSTASPSWEPQISDFIEIYLKVSNVRSNPSMQCCATFLHSRHTKYCRRVMAAHQPRFAYCGGWGRRFMAFIRRDNFLEIDPRKMFYLMFMIIHFLLLSFILNIFIIWNKLKYYYIYTYRLIQNVLTHM
jgi:hypothetical protein